MKLSVSKKHLLALVLAFFLGAFWLFAMRFVLVDKTETHYHANFAVFVDDERLPFDNFTFYEEVAACFGGEDARPQDRVHMHDQVNHVVHVHRDAATWGHFFANLNMTLGDNVFSYEDEVFVDGEQTNIVFYLNGEEIDSVANRVIGNEDVLLISVGDPTDEDLQNQYKQIQKDAAEYNDRQDPSSCSGGEPFTLTERLKEAVGIF